VSVLSSDMFSAWTNSSSVSIMSGYGLDDLAIQVRSLVKNFSSNLCVQTGSGAHPVSCTMAVFSPEVKRGRGVTLTTHPHLVPRSWVSRSYTASPPLRIYRCVVGLLYNELIPTWECIVSYWTSINVFKNWLSSTSLCIQHYEAVD
jgi:hypothetical protein